MQHLVVGNTTSRRAKQWQKAVDKAPYQIVTYQQVAENQFPKIQEVTTVRITSPGEDFDTFKLLVELGGYPNADLLNYEKGRIFLHQYWYKGWSLVLDNIQKWLDNRPNILIMNDPATIKLAFHKANCQQFLKEKGIPIPKIYCQQLNSFEHLLETMNDNQLHQVFLKPAHSSSASGVMMFRKAGNKMLLETTAKLVKEDTTNKLFNHKRLQRYQDTEDIQTILELMIPNKLHVEQWIMKKQFQAKSTDFRVLVINQQPVFIQPRMSNHPITNLHLGNEKGVIKTLEKEWGSPLIKKVKDIATQTAKSLTGLFYAGIDIAVDKKENVYVLEVNPFGDFLKDLFVDNKNTYQYELNAWTLTINN